MGYMENIKEHTSAAALYEQLAEEMAEATKASQKVARILRGESPTPVSLDEAISALREEISDIVTVVSVINYANDDPIKLYGSAAKIKRWSERINHADLNGEQS